MGANCYPIDMDKPNPDWDPAAPQDVPARIAQLNDVRRACPVAYTNTAGGYYAVMKHADIVAATRDAETFSNAGGSRYAKPMPPLEYDPPNHAAYRAMLQPFFAPARVRVIEQKVRAAAKQLLAPLLANGGGDFATDYSYPLPVFGLCALLDIPASRWPEIKQAAEHSLLRDSDDPAERAIADEGHETMLGFARDLIADRRAHPREPSDDITAALIAARENGEPLDDDFMARTLRILFSAGHNSTTSAIGNALLYLANNQTDQERMRADPELMPTAIEEFLRLDTPVQEMPRWATKPVAIAGRDIPQGARLGMFWASGNRDEDVFENAESCILERKPNRHLAFGHGIHTCLGAPMARMELRVALEELFQATTRFTLSGEAERARYHRMGVISLPLALT